MNTLQYDIVIIGGGAAGLAAAAVTAAAGAPTLVIDREDFAGGVLRQCIHNGFGLRYFKEELTGPEFAERLTERAVAAGAVLALGTTVSDITRHDDGTFELLALSAARGVEKIHAKAVLLAMGCRERNRGNIATPGTRPAGIFTAGTAQKLINIWGMLPGHSAVIVGSGDIGLIMARRLMWCGIQVKAVVEIMPHASGLTRNIVQCLNDFGIPLYLSHSVINIAGQDRVTGVDIAPLVHGAADASKAFHIDCDTVLFSVGLVPEVELVQNLGVELNPATGGALVNAEYQTSVPGLFSAGNVLHVHDLVDFVAAEAERAAHRMLEYVAKKEDNNRAAWPNECPCGVGANLKYVIPNTYCPNQTTAFFFRPLIVADRAVLIATVDGQETWRKQLNFVRPAEMISVELNEQSLPAGTLSFSLQEEQA